MLHVPYLFNGRVNYVVTLVVLGSSHHEVTQVFCSEY